MQSQHQDKHCSKLSALAYQKQPVDNQLYTAKSIYQFTLDRSL